MTGRRRPRGVLQDAPHETGPHGSVGHRGRAEHVDMAPEIDDGAATILVVDDDAAAVQALSELLTEEGYEVLRCTDPRTAQRLVEARSPDLVITEVQMTG